jgi:hypothetical protein
MVPDDASTPTPSSAGLGVLSELPPRKQRAGRAAPRWQVIETPPPVRARLPEAAPPPVELPPPPSPLSTGGWGDDVSAEVVPVGAAGRAVGEWGRGDEPMTLLPAPRRLGRVETPPPYLTRRLHQPDKAPNARWWSLAFVGGLVALVIVGAGVAAVVLLAS